MGSFLTALAAVVVRRDDSPERLETFFGLSVPTEGALGSERFDVTEASSLEIGGSVGTDDVRRKVEPEVDAAREFVSPIEDRRPRVGPVLDLAMLEARDSEFATVMPVLEAVDRPRVEELKAEGGTALAVLKLALPVEPNAPSLAFAVETDIDTDNLLDVALVIDDDVFSLGALFSRPWLADMSNPLFGCLSGLMPMLERRVNDGRPKTELRSDEAGGGGAMVIDVRLLNDCERARGFDSPPVMLDIRGRAMTLEVAIGTGFGTVYVFMSKSSLSSSSLSSFLWRELRRLRDDMMLALFLCSWSSRSSTRRSALTLSDTDLRGLREEETLALRKTSLSSSSSSKRSMPSYS